MDQLAILCTGCVAIWLANDKRDTWRRFACLFGLAGQPFWIYSAWHTGQWGIGAVALVYTLAWARGIWNHWIAHA
jgi:hypothetical protein